MSMTKNTKIFLGFLALLLIIFLAYRSTKTGVEKSLIKNEVAKATREPILGKEPLEEVIYKISKAEIPFVNNKQIQHKYDENETNSSEKLVVKWETVDEPKPEDIKNLNELYYEFIEETADARYFKADFTEIFKKKIGDEVTLVIDGEEFEGFITDSEVEYPTDTYYADGSTQHIYNHIRIQSEMDRNSQYIDIGGHLDPLTGEFHYSGDIAYVGLNGGIKYEYHIDNNIGIILPYDGFQNSLGVIAD
jgi:hypothetical protein